jgi:hypothetical protein
MTRSAISKPCLTGRSLGLTVPLMSQGPSAREPGKNPVLLLVLALSVLLASFSGGLFSGGLFSGAQFSGAQRSGGDSPSDGQSQGREAAQADRLLPAGFAHVTPVDAPSQDEFETLSEQLEDPLLALGHHVIGFDASAEAEPAAHGAVCGWAVRAPIFRSSSARGPPLI